MMVGKAFMGKGCYKRRLRNVNIDIAEEIIRDVLYLSKTLIDQTA